MYNVSNVLISMPWHWNRVIETEGKARLIRCPRAGRLLQFYCRSSRTVNTWHVLFDFVSTAAGGNSGVYIRHWELILYFGKFSFSIMYELFPVIFFEQKSKSVKVITKKKTFRNFHLSRKLVFQSIESILEDFSESVNNVWNITDSRNI